MNLDHLVPKIKNRKDVETQPSGMLPIKTETNSVSLPIPSQSLSTIKHDLSKLYYLQH